MTSSQFTDLSTHCDPQPFLFISSLSDLERFISLAEAGLSQTVEEGDYAGLVEVMGHLLAVKERQNTTDAMFEPLKHTIALLKVYEQELPDVVYKQLEVKTVVQSHHILFTGTISLFSFVQLRQSLLFLCVFQLPICFVFSCSWQFIICHSCLPCFSLLLFISLSLHLTVTLQELPEKWNNVRKQAALVKQKVAPLQAIEVASLRRKCAVFDVEQHTFREHFRNNGPFR